MKLIFKISIIIILFYSRNINLYSQNQYGILAFYNLENLYDTINDPDFDDEEYLPSSSKKYNSEKYKSKLNKLEEVLSDIGKEHIKDGFGILGVAEVENKTVLEDLIKQPKLAKFEYKIVHYNSPYNRGVDVGLIYNPKYFKVIKSNKLFVDLSSEDKGKSYTRDILYVKGVFLSEEMHVFVGHWPSRRGGEEASKNKRCIAAKIIRKKIDSIQMTNPKANIVVMGDLNDDPISYSVIDCLNAQYNKNKIDEKSLYNPFKEYFAKGLGTLAYNDSWNLFDQIIVSSQMYNKTSSLEFYKAFIYSKDFLLNKFGKYKNQPHRTFDGDIFIDGYSDHFPTFIILKKNNQK